MLWIEYESEEKLETSKVREILVSLATIIRPYPVCAYDTGNFGGGLVLHDGILKDVFPSTPDSSIHTDCDYSVIQPDDAWESSGRELSRTPSSTGSNLTSLTDQSPSYDGNTPLQNVHNNTNGASGNADGVSPNSADGGATPDDSSDGTNAEDNHNGDRDDSTNQNREREGNGDDEEANDDHSDPPIEPSIPGKDIPEFGTFAGTTHLRFDDTWQQDLDISFDLRIQPKLKPGTVDCVISVDNCIIQAGCVYGKEDEDLGQPLYVSERINITFRPSGKSRVAKNCYPLLPNYAEGNTVIVNKSREGGIEASAHPKATFKAAITKSQIIDQLPITLAIIPRTIGAGSRNAFRWDYDLTSVAQTYLELSSTHPPTHRATYPLDLDEDGPHSFKVKVDVIYGRRGIVPRMKPGLPLPFRFLTDVGTKQIEMSLEATINKTGVDLFRFPTEDKKGCKLDMTLEFNGRKLGQSPPKEMKIRDVVMAKLHSRQGSKRGKRPMVSGEGNKPKESLPARPQAFPPLYEGSTTPI